MTLLLRPMTRHQRRAPTRRRALLGCGPYLLEDRQQVEVLPKLLDLAVLHGDHLSAAHVPLFPRRGDRAVRRFNGACLRGCPSDLDTNGVTAGDGTCHRAFTVWTCPFPRLVAVDEIICSDQTALSAELVVDHI